MWGTTGLCRTKSFGTTRVSLPNGIQFHPTALAWSRLRPPTGGSEALSFWVIHLWVHPCMHPVSMLSYKPVDRISPSFGWWCNSGDRQTEYVLKLRIKVKVTTRSNIWSSYCGEWRHTHHMPSSVKDQGLKIKFKNMPIFFHTGSLPSTT